MIQASITRNAGHIVSFVVRNHGESYVCAAVSMLVINTINSIEALTKADFTCDTDEANGRIAFTLITPRGTTDGHDAGILLNAMLLGLESVVAEHPTVLTISTEERE